ncbi:MAG: hypothetical protein GF347_03490 [Candidatus Moranbacteria bacterium]|nr:hypothetical protein [Candidatus Moranbacteria bacterium]
MPEENKKITTYVYLLVIFILAAGVGILTKNIASDKITTGFEDNRYLTMSDEYDIEEIEEKIKKEQEEKLKNQKAPVQNQGPSPAPANVNSGGSCAQ